MALMIFHLVLSSFTYDGVDIIMAQKVLDWNLKRYPNGKSQQSAAVRFSFRSSNPSPPWNWSRAFRRVFPLW